MKKLLFAITFMTVMAVTYGQAWNHISNINGHLVITSGFGRYSSTIVCGSHYSRPHYTPTWHNSSKSYKSYICLHDENYTVGIDDAIYNYEHRNVEIPHIGSEYIIAVMEFDPQRRPGEMASWKIVGSMTITSEKTMKIELTENIDISVSKVHTYIVYKEYEDFFIDKYINNMGKGKLKRKYGADLYNKEEYDDYVKEPIVFTSHTPKKSHNKVVLK